MCRPNDRRSSRPRPARIHPEHVGGSSPRKTFDPGQGICSVSELGWVSGSSSSGEPGNQRKTSHIDSLELQRDLGREAWDTESTPVLMKKKKKKPKSKRYVQPPVEGPWDDENADRPQDHPFVVDLQKSSVLPRHSATVDTECGLVSRELSNKKREIDSRVAKLVTNDVASEILSVPLCPLEEPPKTAINSQPKLKLEAEVEGNKSVPQSQDKKSLQQDEYKPQPASHLQTLDKNHSIGSVNMTGPQMEVSVGKVESPLEIRCKEGCAPIFDQETMGRVSKPTASNKLPNLTPTFIASNPLESLKEGNDESKMTKLPSDKQKEFSKGAEEVIELEKKIFPKQNQEIGIFSSEQQDKVSVQVPELENEPCKRMGSDGKNRKGRGNASKIRASSGKGRAKSELPFFLDSQKDGKAVIMPNEPAPKKETIATGDKSEELGLASSKQPETMPNLTKAVVMLEPKATADPRVADTLQSLIPLGSGSSMIQTSDAKTEGRTVAIEMGIGNQSKEGKCPWMDHEAAPWISGKPKKRANEGKNKRFKNNYSTQQGKLESKEETLNPPFVGKDEDAISMPHQNKELGLAFPTNHNPLFSHVSDTPTVEVVEQKGRGIEVNSFELGLLDKNKTITVKGSAVIEPATKVTDVSCQEQIQGAEFVPSVLSGENKTDVAKGHTAVTAKPNKRSNDGKSKKVKNSFPEKHILENKIDAAKIHVPMETTGDHRIEGMGYMDENRNITFTCPRTTPGLIGKSTPLETLESAACEKLPAPQVVKEIDSFPDTLAKSRQERAVAQISQLSLVDSCSKDEIPGQERPKTPTAVMPSANTGVDPSITAAVEIVNNHRNNCIKDKNDLADPKKNEAGIDGRYMIQESESLPSGSCKHSEEKITEQDKGHIPLEVPVADQNLPGEVRALEVYANRTNFPTYPVNKKKEPEESAPVQISGSLGDKAQKSNFCEDQNAEDGDSKDPDSLNTKIDVTLLPSKNEKDKLEEISLTPTELEFFSLTTPELVSDFLDGKVEAVPPKVVDKLIMTGAKDLQLPEPKGKVLEVHEKMTEKSEPKTVGERKKDKSRTSEPIKGYMRPTKSRGLTPLLPKSTNQERERSKQLKSSGMHLSWGDVCAYGIQILIVHVNHWFVWA